MAPRAIERRVIPSWTVPMKRTGLSMIRSAMLGHGGSPSCGLELQARPPRGHERVFSRDEERVPEHEQTAPRRIEGSRSCPALRGAAY